MSGRRCSTVGSNQSTPSGLALEHGDVVAVEADEVAAAGVGGRDHEGDDEDGEHRRDEEDRRNGETTAAALRSIVRRWVRQVVVAAAPATDVGAGR